MCPSYIQDARFLKVNPLGFILSLDSVKRQVFEIKIRNCVSGIGWVPVLPVSSPSFVANSTSREDPVFRHITSLLLFKCVPHALFSDTFRLLRLSFM